MSTALAQLRADIDALALASDYNALALRVADHQRRHNPTYRRFVELIGLADVRPTHWREVPCAPIDLFRTQDMRSGDWLPETTFTSSGTTGSATSSHPVRDRSAYVQRAVRTFERLKGYKLADTVLLALLPNYLERGGSGLIAMIDGFLSRAHADSGYFLHDHAALRRAVDAAGVVRRPVILWGVTYALLDLIEAAPLTLPAKSLVIETGGMKGRRRELTREELHERLYAGIQLDGGGAHYVSSEYGMTELLSQAYLDPVARCFRPAIQMRVAVRDVTDPLSLQPAGKTGGLNVIDLANLDTLSFVQTDDLGRVYADGGFEVLGRQDGSAVRGCNLLVGG